MSKKKKTRYGLYSDTCAICKTVCDEANLGEWVELLRGRITVRACRKHPGVVEESDRQREAK